MATARHFRNGAILSRKFNVLNQSTGIGRRPFLAVLTGRYSPPAWTGQGHARDERHMGAKHFGARITRLEDPALLTGGPVRR
jgi:hypothetical protein